MSRYRMPVDPDAPNNPHSMAVEMAGIDRRILEVGCSVGHVTEVLVGRGNQVVGIEIDADAAEEARTHAVRVHVLDLDVVQVSTVETEPFDVILLGDVLEHLRDPIVVLRDLASLLAPGGSFVISVPHVGHIDVRLMLLEGRWEYQDDGLLDRTHLRWFTKASLRQTLVDAGFIAVRVERVVIGIGGSGLPIGNPDSQIVRYIEADPEAHTYQFVVEAQREGSDVLSPGSDVGWPELDAERDECEQQVVSLGAANDALRNEIAAWRRSRIVRYSQPLRSLVSKVRRSS